MLWCSQTAVWRKQPQEGRAGRTVFGSTAPRSLSGRGEERCRPACRAPPAPSRGHCSSPEPHFPVYKGPQEEKVWGSSTVQCNLIMTNTSLCAPPAAPSELERSHIIFTTDPLYRGGNLSSDRTARNCQSRHLKPRNQTPRPGPRFQPAQLPYVMLQVGQFPPVGPSGYEGVRRGDL